MAEIKPMQMIGITGGIGSGKTIVCQIFEALGIPVFNADNAAKKIIENDPILIQQIKILFGGEAYFNGKYNRKYVASKVFGDKNLLEKLNKLIHPKVLEAAKIWHISQREAPYCLYEAAIMKAAGEGNILNKVIVVNAPLQIRMSRIIKRDQRSQKEIKAIIKRQASDEERLKIADFVINNDKTTSLIEQVRKIHQQIITTNFN